MRIFDIPESLIPPAARKAVFHRTMRRKRSQGASPQHWKAPPHAQLKLIETRSIADILSGMIRLCKRINVLAPAVPVLAYTAPSLRYLIPTMVRFYMRVPIENLPACGCLNPKIGCEYHRDHCDFPSRLCVLLIFQNH